MINLIGCIILRDYIHNLKKNNTPGKGVLRDLRDITDIRYIL